MVVGVVVVVVVVVVLVVVGGGGGGFFLVVVGGSDVVVGMVKVWVGAFTVLPRFVFPFVVVLPFFFSCFFCLCGQRLCLRASRHVRANW